MIQTYRGFKLDVFDPAQDQIDIEDIARGLSHTYRFSGFTDLTVAEHCVRMSWEGRSAQEAMDLLMHDAAEAYIGDMPKPIKDRCPEFRAMEDTLMAAIAERYALTWPMPERVKEADLRAVRCEWEQRMMEPKYQAGPWSPSKAEYQFLTRFQQVHRERVRAGLVLPIPAMGWTGRPYLWDQSRRNTGGESWSVDEACGPLPETAKPE